MRQVVLVRIWVYLLLVLSQSSLSVSHADDNAAPACGIDDLAVNVDGCQFGDVIELPGLDFATGSAQLTTKAAAMLDRVARELVEHQDLTLEIAGHTDDSGSDKSNRSLSRRRAATVRSYLILKGVTEQRLTARGYGESSPIADNGTVAGRQRNRRVELRVVGD